MRVEADLKRAFSGRGRRAANLDLLLVEHPQPLQADHVGQALPEGQAVLPDLPVQPVVCHQVDVRDAVGAGDRDVLPTKLQLHHL